jgi:hypothetical protein
MDELVASGQLPLENDPKAKPFTTSQVNQMLWNKYTEKGEYTLLFDVPNIVGVRQERRCDAVAIGMWQSTGRLIHGFEVKVSRSDWLREVKDVTKADHFIAQCDRWWLVAGDASIAKSEEIPDAWGWMTATKTGLRIQRPAKQLPQDEHQMKRLWAFALIRRAAERGDVNSTEFQAQLQKHKAELDRRAESELKRAISNAAPAYERLLEKVKTFEEASGMKLEDWRLGNVGKLARRLNAIAEDGYGGFTRTLITQLKSLERLAKETKDALEAVGDPALVAGADDD